MVNYYAFKFQDTDPAGTFDYIWYKGPELTATSCELFGTSQLENDNTVYPSDHIGILTKF